MAKVAILGLGTVGSGVAEVLTKNADSIARKAGEPVEICLPSHVNQTNLAGNLPGDPMDYRPFVDSTVWPALMEERARAVQALYPAVYGQATR